MAFASQQDDVFRLGIIKREMNCRCTIGLDSVADAAGFKRGFNLIEDRARIFGTGIVAGDDDKFASLARGVAHLGALGPVAVSAAAEERDDTATGFCNELTSKCDQVAQSVVGMRVIHDHGKGLAAINGL